MPKPYGSAQALMAALAVRMPSIVERSGLAISDVRREIAFDRFLARLTVAAPGEWLLKGGVALSLRFDLGAARRTRDVDVETTQRQDLEGVKDLMRRAVAVKPPIEDYFRFAIRKEPERPLFQGIFAYRFSLEAQLDGKVFQSFTSDVGVREEIPGPPELVNGRPFFEFAGIAPLQIPAVPMARHLADKLHGFSAPHGDEPSSRVKDFVDAVLIATHRYVDAQALHDHIAAVYAEHGEAVPRQVEDLPEAFHRRYAEVSGHLAIERDSHAALGLVRNLFDPILSGELVAGKIWNPRHLGWERGIISPMIAGPDRGARAAGRGDDAEHEASISR